MILDLDIGNSRCKWRLTQGAGRGLLPSADLLSGLDAWPFASVSVRRVRICSVRSPEENQLLAQLFESHLGVSPEFAVTQGQAWGVRNGYDAPEQLGVDRWLALLAARQQVFGALLLADAGTALTLDLLGADGVHLGGYILPGRDALLQSLRQGTQGVRVDKGQSQVKLQPGLNTSACVAAAIAAAARGCVLAASGALPMPASLVLCGGDASWLAEICADLPLHQVLAPDLVLDGLALCLPDNFA